MKLIPTLPGWASVAKHATWVCDVCARSLTTRHPSHNIGITMQEAWYCSAPCFTAATERLMAQLLATGSEPVNRMERMPLGLLLISRGQLTRQQLKDATDEQKESGEEIGALLVNRGLVSEKQVAAARATQWGCPLLIVPSQGIRARIKLPPALVKSCSAVPLHYGEATNQLLVGFVHGVDYGLLYAIEHITGCKTQASFLTPSEFELQRRLLAQEPAENITLFEKADPPSVMAGALCKAALDLEAHEAAVAKCKGYLWARLKRDSVKQELLFKTP